jgi:hypothetical protein
MSLTTQKFGTVALKRRSESPIPTSIFLNAYIRKLLSNRETL